MAVQSTERDFWERRAPAWERRAETLNHFSDTYGIPAIEALAPGPGERILDVGCGPGTTVVELARRVGPTGEVVGVDIAPGMVAAAERRAADRGITNVRFVVADAEIDPIEGAYDGVYSRFGVMFFTDPITAFANLAQSLHPGGRLACVVWGPLVDNPWMFVPTLAAFGVLQGELTIPGPEEPGPFSLADPDRVTTVLERAGFSDIAIERIAGVRNITPTTIDDDLTTLLEIGPLNEAYDSADDDTRRAALDAVVEALEPYRDGGGWRLPGSALVVTARH